MKKEKDITGQKFNYLTAIRFDRVVNGKRYWLFRCDCGKEKSLEKYSVTSGRIKSCGCMFNPDITGKKFGRLTAVKLDHIELRKNGQGRPYWLFKCDCGNTFVARKENVMSGHTCSCGCYHKERITKHGFANTRLFGILHGMKQRCYNKKLKCYKNYGGRGITVCDDWLYTPELFYNWAINNGYKKGLTIDRIDNNKGYCPENCRWVTRLDQNRNLRKNRLIAYKGETRCLSDWASLYHLQKNTLKGRLDRCWSVEEAFGIIERRKLV